jgi:ElaB/YqjD/DUF883 family membrane-anchored ribosome-binding protein
MADVKSMEKELKQAIEKEKKALNDAYEDMLGKLKKEQKKFQKELKSEYDDARKYVKDNPETGLGIALAGGLLLGFAISKLIRR